MDQEIKEVVLTFLPGLAEETRTLLLDELQELIVENKEDLESVVVCG